jgi:hypothetical protein
MALVLSDSIAVTDFGRQQTAKALRKLKPLFELREAQYAICKRK